MTNEELLKRFGIDGYVRPERSIVWKIVLTRISFFLVYFAIGYLLNKISYLTLHELIGNYFILVSFIVGGVIVRYLTKHIAIYEYKIIANVR